MSGLVDSARSIVNSRPVRALGPLREGLKKAFIASASRLSKGAKVRVGNNRVITVPWDFMGASRWSEYEPQSLEFLAGLIDREPDAVFVDVGCAIGVYSLLALSVSPRTRVYSFDADLMALSICRHMCRATGGERHGLIWGFCADEAAARSNPLRDDLAAAARCSEEKVMRTDLKPRIGANNYVCMDGKQSQDIPCWDMDSLLLPLAKAGKPLILKVDIEGAEIAMVRGAAQLAEYTNVQMLLSVHPHVLPLWNSSAEEVRKLLADRGYEISLLEISKEQHWWVRKTR